MTGSSNDGILELIKCFLNLDLEHIAKKINFYYYRKELGQT